MESRSSLLPLLSKILIAGSLMIIILLSFFVFDPFRILRKYDSYSYSPVVLNRDYVSVEYFLNNYQEHSYNSFILGNSQTLGILTTDWKRFLPENAKPYHFDASGESLYGIYAKMKLLNEKGVDIDNAILFIREDNLYETGESGDGHIFIKHPAISQRPAYRFYLPFFRVYFQKFFFLKYLDRVISGVYKPYMKGFLENRKVVYTPVNNDLILEDMEYFITHSPDSFYAANQALFSKRDTLRPDTGYKLTGYRQIEQLMDIRKIMDQHGTDFRIVIAPSFNCLVVNPENLRMLQAIFGRNRVYDFSGINDLSRDQTGFYDLVHFRPEVGKRMLEKMYAPVIQD